MREILFRGKRTDNDEWVSGYYVCKKRPYFKDKGVNLEHLICRNLEIENGDCKQFVDTIMTAHLVDPETIGQYTGLTDMNGKKIFEGDLCLCNRNIAKRIDKQVFEIKFDTDYGGFLGEGGALRIYPENFYMCEIVGNIYDDPELLRGDSNG